jgi:hypothetical protein
MRSHEAAEGTRKQDAKQNSAKDGADDTAAFLRRRQVRGKGHENMDGRAHHPDAAAGERKP